MKTPNRSHIESLAFAREVGAEPEAAEDKHAAEDAYGRDALVDEYRRDYHREDGLEIHIIISLDGTDLFDDLGPEIIGYHRGADTEEEDVGDDRFVVEQRQRVVERLGEDEGYGGYDAVEESLAGDKPYVVSDVEAPEHKAVDSPAEGCGKREEVAQRTDLEVEAAVEDDACDAEEGDHRADDVAAGRPFGLVNQAGKHRGYERRGRRQQRDVGRKGIFEGRVLGEEVDRAGAEAAGGKHELVAPRAGEKTLVAEEKHENVGEDETIDVNLGRTHAVLEKNLGRYEGTTPYGDGDDRADVA